MKLNSRGTEIKIFLPPYPYIAAAVISFDYETSAQTIRPGIGARARVIYRKALKRANCGIQDFSSGYGRGYGNRIGAELVKKFFDKAGIKGTWFSTGHALLNGNRSGKSYRINQRLEYATADNGFGFIEWRKRLKSFYHEPYGDYTTHPYYYLGDLTKSLYENGEDIQSHSFSHPYVPLEPIE
ncbi:MAG: hypothetical protein LWX07_08355, partial [Bacteroidetes bacterium]|nr:hypothetical protein [Bacteroidota bacterium]